MGKTLDPRDREIHRRWVEELYQQLSSELPPGVLPAYVNAPQAELTAGRRYLSAYYGKNVDRLVGATIPVTSSPSPNRFLSRVSTSQPGLR